MTKSETSNPLLALENVTVRYGGVVAVNEVSMTVPQGRIVGLIGPNGAGKTTLVDALTGFTRYTGAIRFQARSIDGIPAHKRARLGMARTFQAGNIFDDLTVQENILIGERRAASRLSTLAAITFGRREPAHPETESLIDMLGLHDYLTVQASALSSGQRKLVAVAQALACQPDLILLDEPAAGLDSAESAWLGERLLTVCTRGVTILLVDHDMELVASVCDELVVLDFGQVIAAGVPGDVLADPRVVAAYLGGVNPTGQDVV